MSNRSNVFDFLIDYLAVVVCLFSRRTRQDVLRDDLRIGKEFIARHRLMKIVFLEEVFDDSAVLLLAR